MTGIKVELLDCMGSDLTVVNAARVSFDKWKKSLDERDIRLINFLAREGHTTPFRHVQLQFRCSAPIFLARQLGKHQVGMVWNEVSRRYVDSKPVCFLPDKWRLRPDGGIKQGSGGELSSERRVEASTTYLKAVDATLVAYGKLLSLGVAPEMARMVLPQSMITTWIWTGSLYGFFNVWRQRSDEHAQKEARVFAEALDAQIPDSLANSWEALKTYNP